MKKTGPLHYLGIVLVLAVFSSPHGCSTASGTIITSRSRAYGANLLDIHKGWMLAAVGLTIINYGILSLYDYLAFRFANVPISLAARDLRRGDELLVQLQLRARPWRAFPCAIASTRRGTFRSPKSCSCW